MKIDKSKVKISLDFTPEEYWLCKSKEYDGGDYFLSHKIDRSYAGKDPDIGNVRLYLTEEEAQVFKENGFDELEM